MFSLLFSTAFVNADHELHNVSGIILSPYCELDIPYNWVEDRESIQVFVLQNFLWKLLSVEQLWGRFRWCIEYISWSYSPKSSDKSTSITNKADTTFWPNLNNQKIGMFWLKAWVIPFRKVRCFRLFWTLKNYVF